MIRSYLEDLPNEVLHHVFGYLDLSELIRLRLVCKKFLSSVSCFSIQELIVHSAGHRMNCKGFWSSSKIPINFKLTLKSSKIIKEENRPFKIDNLKYLKLHRLGKIKIDDINSFKKLEILELNLDVSIKDQELNLPLLKGLRLSLSPNDKSENFAITTPIMEFLHIFDILKFSSKTTIYESEINLDFLERIKFTHITPVRTLKLCTFSREFTVFPNVECLEVDRVNLITVYDILKFKKLKKLKLFSYIGMLDADFFNTVDGFRDKNIAIYCLNVRVYSSKNLKYANLKDQLDFQLGDRNFELLDEDDNIETREMDYFYLDRPPSVIKRYTNIRELKISISISNLDNLIDFIRESKNLESLVIQKSFDHIYGLNQQFCNQLPSISCLFELKIFNIDTISTFDFMMRMPYLITLSTDCDLKLDINPNINFNRLEKLKNVKFVMDKTEFTVIRFDKDQYDYSWHTLSKLNKEILSYDDLVANLKRLRDEDILKIVVF